MSNTIISDSNTVVSCSESDNSYCTNDTDCTISLFDDIEQLILQFEEICNIHSNAIKRLETLQILIETSNNITINYKGTNTDLSDILLELHNKALHQINKTGESQFGSNLLSILSQKV